MNSMSLPGFSADASLYETKFHYQTASPLGQVSGVSPQLRCAAQGEDCSSRPCCTGFCGQGGLCDCLDVGEPCYSIGACCTGQCGIDGTCALPASIDALWAPSKFGKYGYVTVIGQNFTPNTKITVTVYPCNGQQGVSISAQTNIYGEFGRDSDGNFNVWFPCWCEWPPTLVTACDDPNRITCVQASVLTCG